MTSEPCFLSIAQVRAVHARVIKEFGGSPELRDQALLESAVFMPQQRFGGALLHADLAAMAAAYLFHLCKNHPFVDGNKRVALAVADVFLRLNGYKLRGTDDELEELTLRVADGRISKEDLTSIMKKRLKREAR